MAMMKRKATGYIFILLAIICFAICLFLGYTLYLALLRSETVQAPIQYILAFIFFGQAFGLAGCFFFISGWGMVFWDDLHYDPPGYGASSGHSRSFL